MKKIRFFFERIMLKRFPRYKTISSNILGFPIKIPDKSSFIFMYDEIFNKEIYRFQTQTEIPVLIDCGANIGLSTIYFKTLYPKSQITSFEPDKKIFDILDDNIKSSRFDGITLINKGLSKESGHVSFFSEGADGGRIAVESDKKHLATVEVTRLSPYLNKHVDFLKIDIEGSEVNVIEECKDHLKNVDNIFIEYHSFSTKKQELDTILNILTKAGFRYYIERVGIESKHPFMRFENYAGYDLQLNISARKI
jgi:FkbM family methyltransferase